MAVDWLLGRTYHDNAFTFPWTSGRNYAIIDNGNGTLTAYSFPSGTVFCSTGTTLAINTTSYFRWQFNGTSWGTFTTLTPTLSNGKYSTEASINNLTFYNGGIEPNTGSMYYAKPFIATPNTAIYTFPWTSGRDYIFKVETEKFVAYSLSSGTFWEVTTGYVVSAGLGTFKWTFSGSSWSSFTQVGDTHRLYDLIANAYDIYDASDVLKKSAQQFEIVDNDKEIDGAISQASTVAVANTKKTNLVLGISQASTVVSADTKKTNLVASVSQPSTVVTAYTKSEGATDYDLVASIEQGSTVSAQNTKAINLVGGISQGQTVVAQNKKTIYILAQVSQGSTVVSHVVKYEPSYDYDLTAEIGQSSEVVASLKKQSSLLGQVSQSSEVGASLTKQTSIVGQVTEDESVVSQASKHIQVIASISQGSTVYSFVTKEELEKTISASVEQQSSVVASVSKQINITALVEQLSTRESVLQRISASRLTTIIRIAEKLQFKEIVLSENLGSKKTGSIQFDEPIRKVVDLD